MQILLIIIVLMGMAFLVGSLIEFYHELRSAEPRLSPTLVSILIDLAFMMDIILNGRASLFCHLIP
jgi:hypothetical protein